MFNRKLFDVVLEVKAARSLGLWAAKIESKVTPSVKIAGRVQRPEDSPASRHSLGATGIIAALSSLTQKNRRELTNIANRQSAERPRLLLRVTQDFAAGLRGDEGALFKVSQAMRQGLNRYLSFFDFIIEEIDEREMSQQALFAFGMRTIVDAQKFADDGHGHFAPSAISMIDREEMNA